MASDGEISCTNDPNFAVIYSFLKIFGKLYGLEVPSISKLQELIENTQEVLEPLKELHLRLLRRALKSVPSNRWEACLIKFCHQYGHHQEAWELERFSYKKASTQVKLKILKLLLEYQFTCHAKFKSAVNALPSRELRLEPIGRDRAGCVYWLHVDHEANLCLYKEDQDEETWQLIARNREELVRVIAQLKSGEEVGPSTVANTNEDSNSAEVPSELASNEVQGEEDNEDEFLSPESESEHEEDDKNTKPSVKSEESEQTIHTNEDEKQVEQQEEKTETCKVSEDSKDQPKSPEFKAESPIKDKSPSPVAEDQTIPDSENKTIVETENVQSPDSKNLPSPKNDKHESPEPEIPETNPVEQAPPASPKNSDDLPSSPKQIEMSEIKSPEEVSEAIEEPVMVVTGDGSGTDCESSYIIGEEITEPVMFFYGEGFGYENDTGNPEAIAQENEAEISGEENGNDGCVNGENHEESISSTNSVKNVKLKSKQPMVTKRSLKKQSTDNSEVLKPDTKKPCVRNLDISDSSNSTSKSVERELKREGSVNEKTTDSDSPNKNYVKKGKSKFKKKPEVTRKLKINEQKEILNAVTETDNGHDSKTNIIEKRKSSLSSEDLDETEAVKEKEKSIDKELKVEDSLPPKKLRLETTPESDTVSHSKETIEQDVNNVKNKDSQKLGNNSTTQRKKIKASKGKFKRKNVQNKSNNVKSNDNNDDDKRESKSGKSKSLKRSLLDATHSDKNKSESQSESEEDEPVTSGKRLKIKPKKIVKSSRKKVEAKLQEKHSTDESEEETLYSIAGKKTSKKVVKRKPKPKDRKEKAKSAKSESDGEEDTTPVRQSRRIAQLKIREEAQRRHQEEVALRELKKIHNKNKDEDEEEEWAASAGSSSGSERKARARVTKQGDQWRASDSTGPEPDSDSDEPLFEHIEPDLDFSKSDHEFSPESDLESGEPAEPLKRARTLQEEKDDGFCKRCGSGEQPEWILLCDRCDAGYHASCLKPLLFLVPEGDWFCPPCNHEMLIKSLESELTKYDALLAVVREEQERTEREKPTEPKLKPDVKKPEHDDDKHKSHSDDGSGSASGSDWSSSSSSERGAVYRLRARRQLPVSLRAQEYDRLISSAIKEEYVEPTTSAGNQGRGKDISTIIEAAEEEKLKVEREALEQGKPIEKKLRKKQRRKPRKLNSLEVPSEDDDETDEDFKDTGMESSSEEISSSAERDSSGGGSSSSDDKPIRRPNRTEIDRLKLTESSPEVKKKKKGVFAESSEESGEKDKTKKSKSKRTKSKRRDKSSGKSSRSRGLTQYDAAGNVIRARVTYGGLSDEGSNDWSPKHRTRQKKINYTETPNTESEDEMHKSSGKHMPDSSDEFKVDDSDLTSDSDSDRAKRKKAEESERSCEERKKALDDLIRKTAVVPLEKLPEDVTKAKTEELQAHLNAQAAAAATSESEKPARGRGSRGGGRGGRGSRGGGRGRGARGSSSGDDALSRLVGVKIKDLKQDGTPVKPIDAEREKKRAEREAKAAEKEAKRRERLQKKEEKEKLKEQKAKEREEKRLARLALQESKRLKKEKPDMVMGGGMGYGMIRAPGAEPRLPYPAASGPPRPPHPTHPPDFSAPRLQVRAELRGVLTERGEHAPPMREGTLSVAGSPQPFKPVTEEPSIITRMPHMINQQYRGPMMYPGGSGGYGARGVNPYGGLGPRPQYPPHYYPQLRALPPYPPRPHSPAGHGPNSSPVSTGANHAPPVSSYNPHHPHGRPGSTHGHMMRPHGQPGAHGPLGPQHGMPGATHGPPGQTHGPPVSTHGPPVSAQGPPVSTHGPPGSTHGQSNPAHGTHGPPGSMHRSPHGPYGLPHSVPGMSYGPPVSTHGPHGHMQRGPGTLGPPGSSPRPGHLGPLRLPGSIQGSPGPPLGPPGPPLGPPGSSPRPHMPEAMMRPNGSPGPQPHNPTSIPYIPQSRPSSNGPSTHSGPVVSSPQGPVSTPGGPPPGPHALQYGYPRYMAPGSMTAPGIAHTTTMSYYNQHLSSIASRQMSGVLPHPGLPSRPIMSPAAPSPPSQEPPVKIKAEVKTEPEYRSPAASPNRPTSPRDDTPRHPKIKHTENKDWRPRYPLGPYAPQYAPFGPYAPPAPAHASPLQRMHQIHQFLPTSTDAKPEIRGPLQQPYDLPPHYLPPHLRPPYLPSATRPSHYAPYQDMPRPPLERQPTETPQDPPREVPPPPRSMSPSPPVAPSSETDAIRDNDPVVEDEEPEPEIRAPSVEDVKPPPFAPGNNVNKIDESRLQAAESDNQPLEEPPPPPPAAPTDPSSRPEGGGVFGGLVSYFSSQHEDEDT